MKSNKKWPPYWGRKSIRLTRFTRLEEEEEKLGTKITVQSKRELKKKAFDCCTLDL
jgi:hypothetical protein